MAKNCLGVVFIVVYNFPFKCQLYFFAGEPYVLQEMGETRCVSQENLAESKHHRLARSLRSGVSGRDAKPTAAERDQLAALEGAPPAAPLSAPEQDLLWKFR